VFYVAGLTPEEKAKPAAQHNFKKKSMRRGTPVYLTVMNAKGEFKMKNSKRIISVIAILTLALCITAPAAPAGAGDASAKVSGTVIAGKDGSLTINGKSVTAKTSNTFGTYDVTGNVEGYKYTHILNVKDGKTAFAADAFPDSKITAKGVSGGALSIDGNYINGISVEGGDYRIKDITIKQTGDGVCDFLAFGNAIGIAGGNVVIDNVTISTLGDIIPALNAGGDSNVVVMNSHFTALGTAEDSTGLHSGKKPFSGYKGAITEVPWVLGLYGTLRATNLIGKADIVYYKTSVEANGWGVYSTDGGANHTLINSYGHIADNGTFGYGYGAYALGLIVNYLGIELDIPTYGIVSRGSFTMMKSTQENLARVNNDAMSMFKKELGGDYSSIEARRNKITARYGVMSHGAKEGTFDISGTDFHVDNSAFLLKDAYMNINVTDTTFNFNNLSAGKYGTILHAMQSDDAGIAMYAYDNCWAICSTFLYADPAPVKVSNEVKATFTGETLRGNFYNTMRNGGKLNLVFDGTSADGAVTSASYIHKNASYYIVDNGKGGYIAVDAKGKAYVTLHKTGMMPGSEYYYPETDDKGNFVYSGETCDPALIVGYCIFYNDARFLNEVNVTAKQAVNNPVYIELKNGSVWNVADVSYIAGYSADATSKINGVITKLTDGTYMASPSSVK